MPERSREQEIAELTAKLDASRGLAGYADRVKAIQARLDELAGESNGN